MTPILSDLRERETYQQNPHFVDSFVDYRRVCKKLKEINIFIL